jgi:hypothetical protein
MDHADISVVNNKGICGQRFWSHDDIFERPAEFSDSRREQRRRRGDSSVY